jgi:dienelactone hydrolase
MRLIRHLTLLLLLTAPAAAGDLLQKPDLQREGEWTLRIRLPEGTGPHPMVIFLPGCAGWSAWERHSADRHFAALGQRGWGLAALDVLGARGLRSICIDVVNLEGLRDDAALAATQAAQALAADPRFDGRRLVFMGQSFGGSVALDLASVQRRKLAKAERVFAGVISYYPWCYATYGMGTTADFDTPVLVLGGALDKWTPVSKCVALAEAQASRETPTAFEVEIYPGAYHSFDLDEMPRIEMAGFDGLKIVAGNAEQAAYSRLRYGDWLGRLPVYVPQ